MSDRAGKQILKEAIEDGSATDAQRREFWLELVGVPKDQVEWHMAVCPTDPNPSDSLN